MKKLLVPWLILFICGCESKLEEGQRHIAAGVYEEAISALGEVEKDDEDFDVARELISRSWFEIGKTRKTNGDWETAIDAFANVQKTSTSYSDALDESNASHYELSKIAYENKQYVDAISHLEALPQSTQEELEVQIATLMSDAHFQAGLISFTEQEWSTAVKHFENVKKHDLRQYGVSHSKISAANYRLGLNYYQDGEWTNAIDLLRKVDKTALRMYADANKKIHQAHFNLGKMQFENADWKKCEGILISECYPVYLEKIPKEDANFKRAQELVGDTYYRIAQENRKSGDLQVAVSTLGLITKGHKLFGEAQSTIASLRASIRRTEIINNQGWYEASASVQCQGVCERRAKWDYEWTDGWFETKFSCSMQSDYESVVCVTDKLKYMNGFGAWMPASCNCFYNIESEVATVW